MNSKTVACFFALAYSFAIPVYVLVSRGSSNIVLSADYAFVLVLLATLIAIGAVTILTWRANGRQATVNLWKRSFDFK